MAQFNVDSVDKQIDDNLSSDQIAGVLNELLFRALKPVLLETNLVECVLASIINPIYSDHRRKFSTIPKRELVDLVFTILATPDKQLKWELIKKSRIERSVWFQIVDLFHAKCGSYLRLEQRYLFAKGDKKMRLSGKLHRIELSLDANRARLGAAIRWSSHYFDLYNQFKKKVTEKYIRRAQQESGLAVKKTTLNIDRRDLFDNLVMAIGKAIDKFDPSCGTLTSYVNMWFMNAKTNPQFGHEYGKSYDVSTTKRRKMSKAYSAGTTSDTNLSVSLDDIVERPDVTPSIEHLMVEGVERSDLFTLVNAAKRTRIARLLLGIPYTLNPDELRQFETVALPS